MHTRRLLLGIACMAGMGSGLTAGQTAPALADAEIRRILTDRIDVQRQSVGVVVGLLEGSTRRVVAHGALAKGDSRRLDGNTVFEIGSVTKVFTALLLADAVVRGEVNLTDPVSRFLPTAVTMPVRGRAITLEDLATHTSGLPRLPTNLMPADATNPYADYGVDRLYAFLSGYALPRDVGASYEYSNLGGGLLGHVLAHRAGMTYEALVETRITRPLGMTSTRIALSPELTGRLASGHGPALEPASNWDLPTLAGAGALRSTTNDMVTFLAAAMGVTPSPLAKAFASMTGSPRSTSTPNLQIALGWHVLTTNGGSIVWHNGGTGGYRSFIGFDPKRGIGAVALSNAGTAAGVDDIGRHLIDTRLPLAVPPPPPTVRTAVAVSSAVLDGLVGRFQLAPAVVVSVTRKGDSLFVQLTGQPEFEMFPESHTRFFLKVVDAQITFETDASGQATAAILHQMGRNQRAPRIGGGPGR